MKKITLLLLAALAFLQVNAQSLPKVQQASVRAPANVRIDGKQTEWGDSFQAYNPSTELSYTIANDDKNLYLTAQANDPRYYGLIARIVARGLTFTIVNNKVKDNKGISVTWPVKNIPDERHYVFVDYQNPGKQIVVSDSLLKANNNSLEKRFKFIKVNGIAGLDTLPVFNDAGIEGSHRFDLKNNYNLEMAIPLDLVRSQINASNSFSYKITINGAPTNTGGNGNIISSSGGTIILDGQRMTVTRVAGGNVPPPPMGGTMVVTASGLSSANTTGSVLEYQSTTSFTGDYTLAK